MELQGTVTVIGDIVEPAIPGDHWESLVNPDFRCNLQPRIRSRNARTDKWP